MKDTYAQFDTNCSNQCTNCADQRTQTMNCYTQTACSTGDNAEKMCLDAVVGCITKQ